MIFVRVLSSKKRCAGRLEREYERYREKRRKKGVFWGYLQYLSKSVLSNGGQFGWIWGVEDESAIINFLEIFDPEISRQKMEKIDEKGQKPGFSHFLMNF